MKRAVDDELREKIRETFSASEDARFVRRLDVLSVVLDGKPVDKAAEMFGIHRSSIFKWLKKARANGVETLRDQSRAGRPGKLDDEMKTKLRAELKKSPKSLGYNRYRWDGPLLSHHLERVYKVKLSVRQCQRLFHELDFSPHQTAKGSASAR